MEESDTIPIPGPGGESNRKGKPGKGLPVLPVILPLVFLLVLCFYATQLKTVFVVEGEKGEEKRQYSTFCRTVGDFLQKNELQVGIYDQLDPAPAEKITNGQVIRIQKIFPTRVGQMSSRSGLEERHAMLENQVAGGVEHPDQAGDPVLAGELAPTREQFSAVESIPVRDPAPAREQVPLKEPGLNSDSPLVGDTVFSEERTTNGDLSTAGEQAVGAVDKDPILGEKNVLSHGNEVYAYISCIEVSATAYCPGTPESGCPIDARGASLCTGFYNDGYTATGVPAVPGDGSLNHPHLIAVDPAVISLKSIVYLEGYGFARAEDTGSAIKGKSIDILFGKHEEARLFGRQRLKIYFLDPHLAPNFR